MNPSNPTTPVYIGDTKHVREMLTKNQMVTTVQVFSSVDPNKIKFKLRERVTSKNQTSEQEKNRRIFVYDDKERRLTSFSVERYRKYHLSFPKFFTVSDKLRLIGAILVFDGIYAQQRLSTAIVTFFIVMLVFSVVLMLGYNYFVYH